MTIFITSISIMAAMGAWMCAEANAERQETQELIALIEKLEQNLKLNPPL